VLVKYIKSVSSHCENLLDKISNSSKDKKRSNETKKQKEKTK